MLDLPGPDLPRTLAVLTAMITPALLLSACGTFVLSTSTRLSRVIDRVRALSEKFDLLATGELKLPLMDERIRSIHLQMAQLDRRGHLLQFALTLFYVAAGAFVATSVAIGILALERSLRVGWVPVALALCGVSMMLGAAALLIYEARLAVRGLHWEMAFLRRLIDNPPRNG